MKNETEAKLPAYSGNVSLLSRVCCCSRNRFKAWAARVDFPRRFARGWRVEDVKGWVVRRRVQRWLTAEQRMVAWHADDDRVLQGYGVNPADLHATIRRIEVELAGWAAQQAER